MPGYVNGIPHATSTDRIDLWPTTSRDLAQWVDEHVPRNDDPRLTNARPPTTHTHPISGVTGLQAALNGKTDTTDPRLSDARPPTTHTHDLGDVTGLTARLAALEQSTAALERVWEADLPLTDQWHTNVSSEVTAYRTGNVVTVAAWRLAAVEGATGAVDAFYLPPGYRPAGLTQQYARDSRGKDVTLYYTGRVSVTDPTTIVAHFSFTFVTLDPPPTQ